MTLTIQPATVADATVISLLGRITFAETFGYLYERYPQDLSHYLDSTFNAAKIAARLAKLTNAYFLALRNGTPIGYAKLKDDAAETVQLQKIYLLREFLGQSFGQDLLHAVLDVASSRSKRIWLDVLKENTRAIRFYEKYGFSPTGEDRYTIGQQTFLFHLMARDLL